MIPTSAFDGCRIDRVPDAGVEIVEADPANRAFPDRVNESLGICLKLGPEHDLWAEGRALRYPRDAVCARTPGSVWSVRATGPVGFVSVDIDREHLPPGGLQEGIRFAEARALPDVQNEARDLPPPGEPYAAVGEMTWDFTAAPHRPGTASNTFDLRCNQILAL